MKVATVEVDGMTMVVRVDGGHGIPLATSDGEFGSDPLRDLLHSGRDLATAPAVGDEISLEDVRWRAPVALPQKIIALGRNYRAHAEEAGSDLPTSPLLFAITANSLTGARDPIRVPAGATEKLDYEAELAVVIGRTGRDLHESEALDHVFGYSVCNDITARDVQRGEPQWYRGKSFDDFLPMGPWVVTADEVDDPQDLRVTCHVNGTRMQDDSTGLMIFGIAETISFVSRCITLQPGDVIATGTPSGVGFARTPPVFLQPGDVLETAIDGIGQMRNVIEERTPREALGGTGEGPGR